MQVHKVFTSWEKWLVHDEESKVSSSMQHFTSNLYLSSLLFHELEFFHNISLHCFSLTFVIALLK